VPKLVTCHDFVMVGADSRGIGTVVVDKVLVAGTVGVSSVAQSQADCRVCRSRIRMPSRAARETPIHIGVLIHDNVHARTGACRHRGVYVGRVEFFLTGIFAASRMG